MAHSLAQQRYGETLTKLIEVALAAPRKQFYHSCRASFPKYVMEGQRDKIQAALIAAAQELTPEIGNLG